MHVECMTMFLVQSEQGYVSAQLYEAQVSILAESGIDLF